MASPPTRHPGTSSQNRRTIPPRLLIPLILLVTVLLGSVLSLLPSFTSSPPGPSSPDSSALNIAQARQAAAHIPASALRYLPKERQPTYWADKRNFVNRVFVKAGWAWTSLAVWTTCGILVAFSSPPSSSPTQEADERRTRKGKRRGGAKGLLKRYLIATIGWILTTQSFPLPFPHPFSAPPLSDRLLLTTGARCVAALGDVVSPFPPVPIPPAVPGVVSKAGENGGLAGLGGAGDVEAGAVGKGGLLGKREWGLVRPGEVELSKEYCVRVWGRRSSSIDAKLARKHKPYWYGGTDLSGHAFLLSLGVLLLIDALRTLLAAPLSLSQSSSPPTRSAPSADLSSSPSALSARSSSSASRQSVSSSQPLPAPPPSSASSSSSTIVMLALAATAFLTTLWWWMLLMTSLHFHGPVEKLLGVLVALVWWAGAEWLGGGEAE